jgi:hypothetical protein
MNRNNLFFGLCIPIRFILGYLLTKFDILKYPILIIGLGFWIIYLFDLRKTGLEVRWNKLRPVHGSLYLLTFIFCFINLNTSKYVIWLDTIIGLISTIVYKLSF